MLLNLLYWTFHLALSGESARNMSGFPKGLGEPLALNVLGVDPISGRTWFELTEEWKYELFPGHSITVPKGFVTDFASTPWYLWWLFPPQGLYNHAVVLHDYLYSIAVEWCSRWLADALMRDVMFRSGVVLRKRWLMWFFVRMCGNRGYWKSK